jgi:predicted aminopeptidase
VIASVKTESGRLRRSKFNPVNELQSGSGSGRRRRVARWIGRTALALVIVAVGYLTLAPTGRYLVRAAWEEGRILAARRPITAVIADSATPEVTRHKLALVLAARAFAADSMGLDAKKSFTTFTQLRSDTLVLVLSGAYPDQLKAKTWWFPIVGSVPYKGYFDAGQATRAAEELKADGFDAYLRPASAFSTLGWFNDPLVSTTLRDDSIELVNTVIHEITHNTYYAPGGATFNESFANFVGARGSAWFFRSRGSPEAADEADARWTDDKLMAQFWAQLYHTVDSAFKAHPDSRAARIAARDTIYRLARDRLLHEIGPQLRTVGPHVLERVRIDNSSVMARRVYLTDVDLFDGIWEREGHDLRRTVSKIIELARANRDRPYDGLRQELNSPRRTSHD